ncbi:Fic family protein [Microbacterium sp. 2216-1]|uniref:Fic family protein n=1 Tax=Microbacterium sp. 2216-1 TaxID=3390053 RepID=UPI00397721D1
MSCTAHGGRTAASPEASEEHSASEWPLTAHGALRAPHHEGVPALMADLVDFSQRTDVPLLAHAATTHAQFETIHSFSDGNGRTGRANPEAIVSAVTTAAFAAVANGQWLVDELSVSDVAAGAAIDRIVNGGALVKTNNYKRNRIWHAPDVLAALDRFGARARRRVL